MQLSSRHLTSASGYFSRLVMGQWKENKIEDVGADAKAYCYVVTAEDWDQKALLALMQIIHARTTTLPTTVTLEMLAKICVLADYYQCTETVEFFVKMWAQSLEEPLPSQFERDVFLRLVVCCVDGDADVFNRMTKLIIHECEEPFESFSLPIPHKVIAGINKKREDLIFSLLTGLQDLADEFYDERSNACSFECKAINLGTLLKAQKKLGILDCRPQPPFEGWSASTLVQAMRGIQVPFPNESRPTRYFCNNAYQSQRFIKAEFAPVCSISQRIRQIIDKHGCTAI
ncbi:hypothetical protein ESCO_006052 [Escovopsis weberi]|uniref:BTB domain-containing protein n=1 Tax=Escovopsis weberi TaxID=150374 RepID=A0A0M8MQB1_ESCWE|nr:hypothetical protein ESCO_006052 [Escovopsis weberi]